MKRIPYKIISSGAFLFPLLFLTAASPFFIQHARGDSSRQKSQSVTISILSKHIRLMREGKLDTIRFVFADNTTADFDDKKTSKMIKTVDIVLKNSLPCLSIGSRVLCGDFTVRVNQSPGNTEFRAYITGGKRRYPLPVELRGSGKGLEIIVTEALSRYAYDSAFAEYGGLPSRYNEAVRALSLIIAGRYFFNLKRPVHGRFDFCDLTHCQVYRGRIAEKKSYKGNAGWIINTGKLSGQLFFHSRCGGHTLDSRVFGRSEGALHGVRDWVSDIGLYLCRDKKSDWTRSLPVDELMRIIYKKSYKENTDSVGLIYDKKNYRIRLQGKNYSKEFSSESFRLRINRVKGWNFLKSNTYDIRDSVKDGKRVFLFSGRGLGHGAGLCQHGALTLARLGFSRYEIIEHYFPEISFRYWSGFSTGEFGTIALGNPELTDSGDNNPVSTPYLSYMIFSIKTGEIEKYSFRQFLRRSIPAGSIFKILVSLYLASEREDLFNEYKYTWIGRDSHRTMPDRCWDPDGHGTNNLSSAVSISCNLYFASLYRHIRFKDFKIFIERLFKMIDIKARLYDISDKKEFARLLSGLDFRVRFTVNDLIKIVQLISPVHTDNSSVERAKRLFPIEKRDRISQALFNAVRNGTASGTVKPYGANINSLPLIHNNHYRNVLKNSALISSIWGKTSTVVEGTNKKYSYGTFIGGNEEKGVIVILRKGNGHLAAKWGIVLLEMSNSINR